MYQPDTIDSYTVGGKTFTVTANEGDARDYDGFSEESKVSKLTLDTTRFPDPSLQNDENLGRLKVTTTLGDVDSDSVYEELYSFGGRSFSIWDEEGDQVFDSGDLFEKTIAELYPDYHNWDGKKEESDKRSDNKGPEPEALILGVIDEITYAFIGMERVSGFFILDISNPYSPEYMDFIFTETFGDISPEGMAFISAEDSSWDSAMLAIANEVSGTTTLYQLRHTVPEPSSLALLTLGVLGFGNLRRRYKH